MAESLVLLTSTLDQMDRRTGKIKGVAESDFLNNARMRNASNPDH
jgi:hypothetical protein